LLYILNSVKLYITSLHNILYNSQQSINIHFSNRKQLRYNYKLRIRENQNLLLVDKLKLSLYCVFVTNHLNHLNEKQNNLNHFENSLQYFVNKSENLVLNKRYKFIMYIKRNTNQLEIDSKTKKIKRYKEIIIIKRHRHIFS